MSKGEDKHRNLSRNLALVLLVVLTAWMSLRSWNLGQSVAGIDYYQFWVVGEAIEHDDVTNPYSDAERTRMGALFLERGQQPNAGARHRAVSTGRTVLETYSTPFLYAVIHGLAGGDYEHDFTRWHAISLLAFVGGVAGLARLVGFGWIPTLALLAGLLAFAAPFQSDTQVGNVNRVQLGVLVLAIATLRARDDATRQVIGGALLGCAAMFKPNVALVVLLLIASAAMRGKPRTVVLQCTGIAGGAAAAFVSSSIFFGSTGAWLEWIRTVQLIPAEIIEISMGNYAPLLFLLGEGSASFWIPLIAVLCVPVVMSLATCRDESLSDREYTRHLVTLTGLGCAIFLTSASLVWEHYFVLALPLVVAVLHRATARETSDAGGWLFARILPGIALLGIVATPTFGISGLPHEVYFPIVQGGATLLLYALGIMQLREPATRIVS